MRNVYITGASMTPFATHWDMPLEHLGADAVVGAMEDAALSRDGIGAVYVGHMSQGEMVGQRILRELDFPPIAVVNVENACASGASALREAWIAVAAGVVDTALVLGVEKMAKKGLLSMQHRTPDQRMGQIIPGSYAIAAQRHMAEFGSTAEQYAWISVKNHDNGLENPHAMYRKACSLDEVLASRAIADPLTLLQCCAPASGAAAVVIVSEEQARRRLTPKAIRIMWSEIAADLNRGVPEDFTVFGATEVAARRAYERAGVDPADLDVVELHDAFTVAELLHYEALQLCARGDGGRLVDERATALGGRIPVNPSGGLLSRGHPTGATGVAQAVELVWQLRGTAGRRQVANARLALAQCQGGVGRGNGAAAVTILAA
jgi:benzoylsuccinyl-CoA thiolase BbsB subunit